MGYGLMSGGSRSRKPKPKAGKPPGWKSAQQGAGSVQRSPFFGRTAPTYAAAQLPGGASGSYYGDPAYELAKAFSAKTRAESEARAKQKKTEAAIQYGDASGLGLGANVEKEAANNPFSVVKSLKYGYDQGVKTLEDELNKANLFYSGYRGEQLGDAAHQYQQAGYNAKTGFQGLLSDIADQLSQALMNADYQEMMAALNAGLGSFGGGYQEPQPPPQYGGGYARPPQLRWPVPGQKYSARRLPPQLQKRY